MSTNPPIPIPATEVDDAWALPPSPTRECSLSGPAFARLVDAAKRSGWEGVWSCWAEGETVTEINHRGNPVQRPRRRRTLGRILERRPDLRLILEEAAQEKRSRLISQLENVAERVALGPPDTCTDYDSKGNVTRVRTDSRNRNYMVLALLKANDPKYADKRSVTVDGEVKHAHAHAHLNLGSVDRGGYRVDPDAIEAALSLEERREFMVMLERIEAARMDMQRQRIAEQNQRPALPGQTGDSSHE